jgi:hypothetical protein
MNSNVTQNSFDDEVIDGVVGHPGPPLARGTITNPLPVGKACAMGDAARPLSVA